MATRLLPERVPIASEELSAEVYRCASWPIQQGAVRLWAAFLRASGAAEMAALRDMYEFFVTEAQPTWDLIDQLGPVPPTTLGMLRLNHVQACRLVLEWAQTLEVVPPSTAVDELLPDDHPLREMLSTELRKKRRADAE